MQEHIQHIINRLYNNDHSVLEDIRHLNIYDAATLITALKDNRYFYRIAVAEIIKTHG